MKCPRCWTEKAYLRRVSGWRRALLACLLLRPMKCQHYYFQFVVPWLCTLGKQVIAPVPRAAPSKRAMGLSYAAQECAIRKHPPEEMHAQPGRAWTQSKAA